MNLNKIFLKYCKKNKFEINDNQLDVIEDDTDAMQIELRQQLMAIEGDLNPVEIMFLYKILEWVGGIADQAQRVGARLRGRCASSLRVACWPFP